MTQVPPLRVRPGDVADLARYFVGQAARRKGLPQARLTEEAVKHLESYTFPNNIKVSAGQHLPSCPLHFSHLLATSIGFIRISCVGSEPQVWIIGAGVLSCCFSQTDLFCA